MDVWAASPGFAEALQEELRAAGRAPEDLAADLVSAEARPGEPTLDPVFALQALPGAVEVRGDSIARLAAGALDALAAPLDACGPWVLHAWALDDGPAGTRARRVGEALRALFQEKRRRTARRCLGDGLVDEREPGADLRLAQLLLVEPDRALVSCAAPRALPPGGWWPEPRFAGGRAPVGPDPQAPSSAYRKAEEAYALLGRAPGPGERCVDLGGAPGGWSWTALKRGADVLAIDRAPLLPPAGGHARLEARQGDAFKFAPAAPVDWLLCDVIAAPARTLELLERWLERGWCRRFVVTVKFKGTDRAADLAALAGLLARRGARARVKHLRHGKNEVTAFGLTA